MACINNTICVLVAVLLAQQVAVAVAAAPASQQSDHSRMLPASIFANADAHAHSSLLEEARLKDQKSAPLNSYGLAPLHKNKMKMMRRRLAANPNSNNNGNSNNTNTPPPKNTPPPRGPKPTRPPRPRSPNAPPSRTPPRRTPPPRQGGNNNNPGQTFRNNILDYIRQYRQGLNRNNNGFTANTPRSSPPPGGQQTFRFGNFGNYRFSNSANNL